MRQLDGGEVASHTPELTRADPGWLGIALVSVDGEVYQAGDPMARIMETFGRYTGRDMAIDETVYRSESDTGHHSRTIAHLFRSHARRPLRSSARSTPVPNLPRAAEAIALNEGKNLFFTDCRHLYQFRRNMEKRMDE
jgi:hypothetical protein